MIRTQVLKHLPGAKKGERRGSKGDVRGETTAREAKEMSRYVRVIEGEEVKRDDLVEYFLSTVVRSTFSVLEGMMTIEVPRMKRFLEEGRIEGEKEFCHPMKKSKKGERKH